MYYQDMQGPAWAGINGGLSGILGGLKGGIERRRADQSKTEALAQENNQLDQILKALQQQGGQPQQGAPMPMPQPQDGQQMTALFNALQMA